MAYTGVPIQVTGATCVVGVTEVAGGGTVDATITVNAAVQELPVWGSHPNPKSSVTAITVTGTVNYVADGGQVIVQPSATAGLITITATGFYFIGTCLITSASVVISGSDVGKASFTFQTTAATTPVISYVAP